MLRGIAAAGGRAYDERDAAALFDRMDANRDGRIEFVEFVHALTVMHHPQRAVSLAATAAAVAPLTAMPAAWAATATALGVNAAVRMKLFADASPLTRAEQRAERRVAKALDNTATKTAKNKTATKTVADAHDRHDDSDDQDDSKGDDVDGYDDDADPWVRRTCVVPRSFEPRFDFTEHFVFECTRDFVAHMRAGRIAFEVYHHASDEVQHTKQNGGTRRFFAASFFRACDLTLTRALIETSPPPNSPFFDHTRRVRSTLAARRPRSLLYSAIAPPSRRSSALNCR